MRAIEFTQGKGKNWAALPGWERYGELFGDSPASRTFFVEMLQANGELLRLYEAFDSNPLESERLDQSIQWCGSRLGQPNMAATATSLLMIATDQRISPSEESQLVLAQLLLGHFQGPWKPKDQPELNLLRTWIKSPDCPIYNKLQKLLFLGAYSSNLNLQEATLALAVQALQTNTARVLEALHLPLAKTEYFPDTPAEESKILQQKQAAQTWGWLLPCAVEKVMKYGDESQLNLVNSFLEQMPQVPNDFPRQLKEARDIEVSRVRTYSLAVLVQLSGQPLNEYGLEQAVTLDPNKGLLVLKEPIKDPVVVDKRIAKWRKWYKSQPQANEKEGKSRGT